MEFGFSIEGQRVREHTPEIFRSFNRKERYKMFLAQYNACVEDTLRIPPSYGCKYRNLRSIFHAKIDRLLETPSTLTSSKALTFCAVSEKMIRAYREGRAHELGMSALNPSHPAAKLIAMVYAKTYPGVSFEATSMFSQYVFDKICKRNKDKKVFFENEMIIIEDKGVKVLGVLPCFKHVTESDPYLVKDEINQGFSTLADGNIPQLFLVFPRNKEFKRHVALKESHFEKGTPRLKLVPYSISNKIVRSS